MDSVRVRSGLPLCGVAFVHPCGRALSRGVRDPPSWRAVGWLALVSAVEAGPKPRGKVERPLDERRCRRPGPAQDHGTRRPGQRLGDGSHAPIRAPGAGIRMTVSPDPGCSVRSTAVLQAHAQTRARTVLAFSGGLGWASSWMRMWKDRASSRRAMATVAMLVPGGGAARHRRRRTGGGAWPSGRPPARSPAPTVSPAS